MNESQIEALLRRAPKLAVPSGLLAQLQADIVLPRVEAAPAPITTWLRRWIPALSFGAFILGCLVVLAIQTNELTTLRRENQTLLQNAAGEPSERNIDTQVLESLRKDQRELENLRTEIERSHQALALLPELQSQIEQLRAQTAAALTNNDDAFAAAKEKADSTQCINNMKQIGLALRKWNNDNQDIFPPDFLSITNKLKTPKVFVCPGDAGNLPAEASWERFNPARVSYDYFGAGQTDAGIPEWALTRCRVHGHVGLYDGSVHWNRDNRFQVVPEDGKYKLVR
jgi:hypothetical protein